MTAAKLASAIEPYLPDKTGSGDELLIWPAVPATVNAWVTALRFPSRTTTATEPC